MENEWSSQERLRSILVHFPAKCYARVALESSSHFARRPSSRASATSFTLLSSVHVLGLPVLGSLFMLPPRFHNYLNCARDKFWKFSFNPFDSH